MSPTTWSTPWAGMFVADPRWRTGLRYTPPERAEMEARREDEFFRQPSWSELEATGEEPVVLWFRRVAPGDASLSALVELKRPGSFLTLIARSDREELGGPGRPESGYFVHLATAADPGVLDLEVGRDGRVAFRRTVPSHWDWLRVDMELEGSQLRLRVGGTRFAPIRLGIRNESLDAVMLGLALAPAPRRHPGPRGPARGPSPGSRQPPLAAKGRAGRGPCRLVARGVTAVHTAVTFSASFSRSGRRRGLVSLARPGSPC